MAYYIINKEMPISSYMAEAQKKNPDFNLKEPYEYKSVRLANAYRFQREFSNKDKNPFYALYNYLIECRD